MSFFCIYVEFIQKQSEDLGAITLGKWHLSGRKQGRYLCIKVEKEGKPIWHSVCQCVMKISAVSIWSLVPPGPTENSTDYFILEVGETFISLQPLFAEDYFWGCLISTLVSCISNWSGNSVSSQGQKDLGCHNKVSCTNQRCAEGKWCRRASELPSTDSLLGDGNGRKLGKSVPEKSSSLRKVDLQMEALSWPLRQSPFQCCIGPRLDNFPTDRWREPNSHPEYVS